MLTTYLLICCGFVCGMKINRYKYPIVMLWLIIFSYIIVTSIVNFFFSQIDREIDWLIDSVAQKWKVQASNQHTCVSWWCTGDVLGILPISALINYYCLYSTKKADGNLTTYKQSSNNALTLTFLYRFSDAALILSQLLSTMLSCTLWSTLVSLCVSCVLQGGWAVFGPQRELGSREEESSAERLPGAGAASPVRPPACVWS